MNRLAQLITLLLLTSLLNTGCDRQSTSHLSKPLIITTIHPYELIVQELVDTLFTVETLLPPTASPHTWSPGPQDLKKLQEADLIISNGLGLEVNLDKYLSQMGSRHLTAANYIDQSLLISESDKEHEAVRTSGEHSQEEANPHIWTSPDFLTTIITGLSNELGKRYPGQKDSLQSRARQIIREINREDGKIKADMKHFDHPAVLTLHDAFVYYFRYFQIDFLGSVEPSAGREPSPRQLKELADKVRVRQVKAIFLEPQLNPKPAETLARELNLKVLKYDDLGTTLPAKTISEYLWQNWLLIKEGL